MISLGQIQTERDLGRYLKSVVPNLQDLCSTAPFDTWSAALCLWRWLGQRMAYPGTDTNLSPNMTGIPMFQRIIDEQAGVWCGGAARIFAACLRGIGLPACEYAYGYHETGLTHATTIVFVPEPVNQNRFCLLDVYLGYYYTDAQTGDPLLFDELLWRIIEKRYNSIAMHVEPHERPFIIRQDDDPRHRAFLFPGGQVPNKKEPKGDLVIYRGAVYTPDKLVRGLCANGRLIVTPFGELLEQARGDQPEQEFMLDLLLVHPWFDPFVSENNIGGTDRSFRNTVIKILAGGLT